MSRNGTSIAFQESESGDCMDPDRIECPACGNSYPIPEQVSREGRLRVRCPACGHSFRLRLLVEAAPPEEEAPEEAAAGPELFEEPEGTPPAPPPETEDFTVLERRARRLARALLTDLVRGRDGERKKALSEGTLLLIFGERLETIWRDYRGRLPREYPEAKAIFREAVNDIFADGKQLF